MSGSFVLIWKLDLVTQNNSEFLGMELALGLWVSITPASCSMRDMALVGRRKDISLSGGQLAS